LPATFKQSEFPSIREDNLQDLPTDNKVTAKQVDFTGAVLFEKNTPAESVPLLATRVCSNHLLIRGDNLKDLSTLNKKSIQLFYFEEEFLQTTDWKHIGLKTVV